VQHRYEQLVDYFANKRYLVWVGLVGTVLGVATEVLENASDTALEVQGVGIWQALPILLAFAGQMRANSNRYLDEVRASYDRPDEQVV